MVGLILNFIGSIVLSVEALGASAFFSKYKDIPNRRKDLEETHFYGSLNNFFVFLVITLISSLVLLIFNYHFNVVLNIIVSPLVFVTWKILVLLSRNLKSILYKIMPSRKLSQKGCFSLIVYSLITVPWCSVYLIASILNMLIKYGIDLTFRFIAEKIILKYLYKVFFKLYLWEENSIKGLKKHLIIGFVLFSIGFCLQFIAIILKE